MRGGCRQSLCSRPFAPSCLLRALSIAPAMSSLEQRRSRRRTRRRRRSGTRRFRQTWMRRGLRSTPGRWVCACSAVCVHAVQCSAGVKAVLGAASLSTCSTLLCTLATVCYFLWQACSPPKMRVLPSFPQIYHLDQDAKDEGGAVRMLREQLAEAERSQQASAGWGLGSLGPAGRERLQLGARVHARKLFHVGAQRTAGQDAAGRGAASASWA